MTLRRFLWQKWIATVLIGTFVIQPLSAFAAFPDVNSASEREAEAIEFLQESDIIGGYPDGTYQPSRIVNRAEWAKVLIEGTGVQTNPADHQYCFPDVTDEWFARYICYGRLMGYWKGRPDGKFYPGDPVNLVEALKMAQSILGIDIEEVSPGGAWYEAYRQTGLRLGTIDDAEGAAPAQPLTRAVMARLFLRTALSSRSKQAYKGKHLRYLQGEKKTLKDVFSDSRVSGALQWKENPELQGDDWTVKIRPEGSGPSFKEFDIRFGHHDRSYKAYEGRPDEVYIYPTLSIAAQTGQARIGLDGDSEWEGWVTPKTQFVDVDADTSGTRPSSMNLRYDVPTRTVLIRSRMARLQGTFNLNTGVISGDKEITKGYVSLHDYFRDHRDAPFTVCVSDRKGYEGEVGIFPDFLTVGVRPCKKTTFGPKPPGAINPPVPWEPKRHEPLGGGPGGGASGGSSSGGGGLVGLPGGGGAGPGGGPGGGASSGSSSGGGGVVIGGSSGGPVDGGGDGGGGDGGSKPDTSNFPKPPRHPGKGNGTATGEGSRLRAYKKKLKKEGADDQKSYEESTRENEKNRKSIEEIANRHGVTLKPWRVPPIGDIIKRCCPGPLPEDCCKDLDLTTVEGRNAYLKRINCLIDGMNELIGKLYEKVSRLNFLIERIANLEPAEGNFALMSLGMNINKKIVGVGIDVVTGGKTFRDFIKGLIKEFLGDEVSSALEDIERLKKLVDGDISAEEFIEGGIDDALSDVMEEALGEEFADAVSEGTEIADLITKYETEGLSDEDKGKIKDKLKGLAGKIIQELGWGDAVTDLCTWLADFFGLKGNQRDRFKESVGDRFSDPINLFDPAEWANLLSELFFDSAGGVADDFLDIVQRFREEREKCIKEIYDMLMEYQAYLDALNAVRKECKKPFCDGLLEEADREDEKDEESTRRWEEDAQYIADLVKAILEEGSVRDGNPDGEELTDRVKNIVRWWLRENGYDDCWFDIILEITVTYHPDGSVEWDYKFGIVPREEPREGCPEDEPVDVSFLDDISLNSYDGTVVTGPQTPATSSSSVPEEDTAGANSHGYDGTILTGPMTSSQSSASPDVWVPPNTQGYDGTIIGGPSSAARRSRDRTRGRSSKPNEHGYDGTIIGDPVHSAGPSRPPAVEPNSSGYDGTILWYKLDDECKENVQECESLRTDCKKLTDTFNKASSRCQKIQTQAPKECRAYMSRNRSVISIILASIISAPPDCKSIKREYEDCREKLWEQEESMSSCSKKLKTCTSRFKYNDCIAQMLEEESSDTLSVYESSSSRADTVTVTTSSVADRVVVSSSSSSVADTVRTPVESSSSFVAIIPESKSSSSSAAALGMWEFLDVDAGWQPTVALPYGHQVHFIVASDPDKNPDLDIREFLPISIELVVDNLAAPIVYIEGSIYQVCRGPTGCSLDGPVIPQDWVNRSITLKAYGSDGSLLAEYEQ